MHLKWTSMRIRKKMVHWWPEGYTTNPSMLYGMHFVLIYHMEKVSHSSFNVNLPVHHAGFTTSYKGKSATKYDGNFFSWMNSNFISWNIQWSNSEEKATTLRREVKKIKPLVTLLQKTKREELSEKLVSYFLGTWKK